MSARLGMSAVVGLATGTGVLASVVLLHLHLWNMPVRYGISVALAYGVFLIMLGKWAPTLVPQPVRHAEPSARSDESTSLWEDWDAIGDLFDLFDIPESPLILLALVAAVSAIYLIVTAPVIMGEVVIAASIVPALRRTGFPFACVLAIFIVAGLAAHGYAPEAASIGGVVRHYHAAQNTWLK